MLLYEAVIEIGFNLRRDKILWVAHSYINKKLFKTDAIGILLYL